MYSGFDAPPGFDTIDRNSSADNAEFPMIVVNQPPPLFDKEADWGVCVLDSDRVALMFGMPMEIDVTIAILRFIPEIIWHAGIQTILLEILYGTFLECFDRSSGHPVLKPAFRDMAYLSAKALLHIGIQRKCICDESDKAVLESISSRHRIMGSNHYKDDSDLESIFGIVDHVLGNFKPMCWQNFSFTVPHHTWMAHILLYRAWDVVRRGNPLPDDIRDFILHSLQLDPPPPVPIVTDCLFMVGLVLGISLHAGDLLVVDKR